MNRTPDVRAARQTNRWGLGCCALLLLAFVGLGVHLALIETHMSARLIEHRDDQRTRSIAVAPMRGMILDTRGRILAGTTMEPSVFADPAVVQDIPATCAQLAPILGMPPAALAERIAGAKSPEFVWLARRVSQEQAAAVTERKLRGIGIRPEPQRQYPNGTLLAHVLGFVGIDGHGLEGVELGFDRDLAGVAGRYRTTCDARRRPLWTQQAVPDEFRHGNHVVLTIDLVIQSLVEDVLFETVRHFHAESGVALAMSPSDGHLLAMASVPTFDPNHYNDFSVDARRNRCITDPVEPGSCFKPFIMSAALAEGRVALDEQVDCGPGEWRFPMTRGVRRLRDTHPNGVITFEEVLVESSNIGMAHVGMRLGIPTLYRYVRAFGFGERTGIELPGESAGILSPLKRWTSFSKTSVPIGQELAVTPLQLLTAFAALVNGGERHAPTAVQRLLDAGGQPLETQEAPAPRPAIPASAARQVAQRALVRVVNDSHHNIQLDGYQAIGKTGTAEVPYPDRPGYEPGAYLASFLGAAPAEDPQIAVVVMIRKPDPSIGYYGGLVSGPAVKKILERTLAYWNVPSDRGPWAERNAISLANPVAPISQATD